MSLQPKPFAMIQSGQKTVELRLYDAKRQAIRPGDRIVFSLTEDPGKTLTAVVVKLHRFDSFAALYQHLPLLSCGYTEQDIDTADASDMDLYYTKEQQKKYGVVGIELALLSEDAV